MQRVHALMNKLDTAVDVVDAMTVEFDNGALGTVCGTGDLGKDKGVCFELQIFCQEGWIGIDGVKRTIRLRADEALLATNPPPLPKADDRYRGKETSHNGSILVWGCPPPLQIWRGGPHARGGRCARRRR